MNMLGKYVICTTQRTGSSWLVDMLDSHSNIGSYAELFRLSPEDSYPTAGRVDMKLFEKWQHDNLHSNWLSFLNRKKEYLQYLSEIELVNIQDKPVNTFGCKIMYSQFREHKGLFDFSSRYFDKVIHLKRRDHLRAVVSKTFMENAKITHSATEVELPRVELNIAEIIWYLKKHKSEESSFEKKLAKLDQAKVITCYYEDLVDDNANEMKRIHQHLGVDYREPQSTFKKINNKNLAELIINYDELLSALKANGFNSVFE